MALKYIHLFIKLIIFNIIFIKILSAQDVTIDFEDGSSYVGGVIDGMMEGKGIFTSSNNTDNQILKYEGDFKNGKFRVLISSNVTARGIDIQQVSTVINFDIPKCVHTYLHRIGRSGRWGRKGLGINFVTRRDVAKIKTIEQHYQTQIQELPKDFGKSY